ncbi:MULTISPECIES: hypothetical protein [Bacillus]|uniref:hypothetical protein n=1 Tax=Bacillus TaxID=1386 RepID=UPI000BB8F06B|nr:MULTISPECIES: hypothetical protein [Bacillus]
MLKLSLENQEQTEQYAMITTIDDKEFFEELVKELDNANTHSTAHNDWALPDYKLIFKINKSVTFQFVIRYE